MADLIVLLSQIYKAINYYGFRKFLEPVSCLMYCILEVYFLNFCKAKKC